MKAIINAHYIGVLEHKEDEVLLFDTQIISWCKESELPINTLLIDAKGAYVSAGFIELHIHGSANADVMDATLEALQTISSSLLQTGTTSFLPTTMTMSNVSITKALQNIKLHKKSVSGAKILGVHLEGPFINTLKHGAQDKAYIQLPNKALIEDFMHEVKMITLAPEIEGAKAFIEYLAKNHSHIVLSIGHSDASYDKSMESFSWGISHATHLFNAMNTYHHREPGIVGAVFDSDITCDVIADLVHTHPSTLGLVQSMKKEKLILITDAMRAGCMKCGSYDLGGREVYVEGAKATLLDGTLAGSVLKLNDALKNMVQHTDMTREEAVYAVTKAPAQKLGLKKGQLKVGYDADIVIFDEDFSIISTIVAGEVKYKAS